MFSIKKANHNQCQEQCLTLRGQFTCFGGKFGSESILSKRWLLSAIYLMSACVNMAGLAELKELPTQQTTSP